MNYFIIIIIVSCHNETIPLLQDEKHLSHGEPFSEAVAQCCQVNRAQLMAVGVNCLAPALVSPLLQIIQGHDVPFIVYPNSGEIWKPGVGQVT